MTNLKLKLICKHKIKIINGILPNYPIIKHYNIKKSFKSYYKRKRNDAIVNVICDH